jgi:amino acid transporter
VTFANQTPEHQGFGPTSATAIVAASMIGSGVYVTSGYLIADMGSAWWVLLAWLVGGVIAFSGATVYAALATKFTESGGEYILLARAAHPAAGIMAGWVSLLAGFTGAIALAAQTCETYLLPLLPSVASELPPHAIAIILVVTCAMLNLGRTGLADGIQQIIVLLKLVLIIVFVGFAWSQFPIAWDGYNERILAPWPGTLKFATSLMWISLSYCGFNAAIYMAGEVRKPSRNVPIGLLAGTVLVAIVYLLLNSIFVLVPSFDQIAGKEDVAAIAAQSLGGSSFVAWVRVIIVLSLCSSVSAMTMAGPRVYAKMAEDGFLPRIFSNNGCPTAATIVMQGALAVLAIEIATVQWLISYLGFTLTVTAALTCCLIFLPGQRDAARCLPLYPLTPIVFVVGTATTATLAAVREPKQAFAAIVTILIGALVHVSQRRHKR